MYAGTKTGDAEGGLLLLERSVIFRELKQNSVGWKR